MPQKKTASKRGKTTAKPDHRTVLGQERRERTQQRILSAALGVFAAKGGVAPVIDDFIKAAGVARGTFYNYYASVEELLTATIEWLENDLIAAIEHEMEDITDPAERFALGVRLWLAKAENDPVWCAFVARTETHGERVEQALQRDLGNGQREGLFGFDSVDVARDLAVGALHEAMRRMTAGPVPKEFTQEIAHLVFRGLGMSTPRILAAFSRPLPAFRRPLLAVNP